MDTNVISKTNVNTNTHSIECWYDKEEGAWLLVVKDSFGTRVTPIIHALTPFARIRIEEDLKNEFGIQNS